jgi:photosystem II stability/assembly factor-like uncharacterized protein
MLTPPVPPPLQSRIVAAVLAFACALAAVAAHAARIKDNLYGVDARSATEAWAVGNFGAIFHTTDGGTHWTRRESNTKQPLFAVDFADATHGWVVGKSALILATTDGGTTWTTQQTPIPPGKPLFMVRAVDARTAWAVGDWGAITATHDGGATWEDRSFPEDVVLYDLAFPDPEHGYIVGEFGTLLVTDDGGRTWRKQNVGVEKTLFGVSFASRERGWAVGMDGLVLQTKDAGATWTVQRGEPQASALEDVGFADTIRNPGIYDVAVAGRYGVIAGDVGLLLTTEDGGDTWVQRELPDKQKLVWMRGVGVTPDNTGFVVGAAGFSARLDGEKVVYAGSRTSTN